MQAEALDIQEVDLVTWFKPTTLPTPGVPLLLKLNDGEVIEGIRPNYISSRTDQDQGYRDLKGNRLDKFIMEWAIA